MLRTAVILAALILWGPAGFAQNPLRQDQPKTEPFIIGDATMTDDGTIVVNLRRTKDGMNISGVVRYPVDHPNYRQVLDHLGGMRPGETKLVPAWDDPAPERK